MKSHIDGNPLTDTEIRDAVARLLDTHSVLTMATLHAGRPHAVSLIYANDDLSLYWLSSPDSRHSLALQDSPAVSITIARQYTDFQEICGLQMRGDAWCVTDKKEIERGVTCLSVRYPFLKQFQSGAAHLMKQFDAASVYRFDANEITLIDNGRGFGFKQTLHP